jgi:hypothetical protein
MFKEDGMFDSVTYSRVENKMKLDGNIIYEPDIITKKGKITSYYEYEFGNHKQADFNAKLNKMCKVTNIINLIVPNKTVFKHIQMQVEQWIQSRGGPVGLGPVKIRIATARSLQGVDTYNHDNWQSVYDKRMEKNVGANGKG